VSSSSSRQDALARRALIEDIKENKRGWVRHGVAALAVSLLGLGVAGSVVLTGNAEHTSGSTAQTTTRVAEQTSRGASRAPLDAAKVKSLADQRAEELSKADSDVAEVAKAKSARARAVLLAGAAGAAGKQAKLIATGQASNTGAATSSNTAANTVPTGGKGCLPVTSGYSIAARFGQVGSWARYHTGLDFAAPIGTPIHAPAAGVVLNAGRGSASGWAGNYVAIRYPDGTQSLMAHMSTVSVNVGQTVSACQVVGAIGMTGRTFGPHVHFEIYPAGITPGDVYKAVNPVPWLHAHGLNP
jgi:murein DD-endopeptidase MepM/ murein hydrolase activator NlpD